MRQTTSTEIMPTNVSQTDRFDELYNIGLVLIDSFLWTSSDHVLAGRVEAVDSPMCPLADQRHDSDSCPETATKKVSQMFQ